MIHAIAEFWFYPISSALTLWGGCNSSVPKFWKLSDFMKNTFDTSRKLTFVMTHVSSQGTKCWLWPY